MKQIILASTIALNFFGAAAFAQMKSEYVGTMTSSAVTRTYDPETGRACYIVKGDRSGVAMSCVNVPRGLKIYRSDFTQNGALDQVRFVKDKDLKVSCTSVQSDLTAIIDCAIK